MAASGQQIGSSEVTRILGCFLDDEPSSLLLSRSAALAQGFRGQAGHWAVAQADGALTVWIGLGPRARFDPGAAHRALGVLSRLTLPSRAAEVHDIEHQLSSVLPPREAQRLLATAIANANLTTADGSGRLGETPLETEARRLGKLDAAAVAAAKRWTNAPGSDLPPAAFVEQSRAVAQAQRLRLEVLGPAELEAGGFGAILGVGAGSARSPHLIDLRYEPKHPVAELCLVGKGVTFDTGGLSLKSPTAMAGMRMDKAGASAVLSVMSVVADLGAPVSVRALLPMVENMIGPDSLRPGDVVVARDGTRVRVMDTDFEGRLILADALAYAAEATPDVIIDTATLTHQVVVALGPEIAGFFASSDSLATTIQAAASSAGEPLWRLPLHPGYLSQTETSDGVKNHPETDTGRAITAALFLSRFVGAHAQWAHIDMSGPAWKGPFSEDGATGYSARTLIRVIQALARRKEVQSG